MLKHLLAVGAIIVIFGSSVFAQGQYLEKGMSGIGFAGSYVHSEYASGASMAAGFAPSDVYDFGLEMTRIDNEIWDRTYHTTWWGVYASAYPIKYGEPRKRFTMGFTGSASVSDETTGVSAAVVFLQDVPISESGKASFQPYMLAGFEGSDSRSAGVLGIGWSLYGSSNPNTILVLNFGAAFSSGNESSVSIGFGLIFKVKKRHTFDL